MSKITKLYENAGIETNKYKLCCTGCKHIAKLEVINGYPSKWICDKYDEVADCDRAEPEYPPFTAEKQIAILQLLTQQCDLTISHFTEWEFIHYDGQEPTQVTGEDFAETFAKLINAYWQSLTEEEKQQVKGILE